MKKMDEDDEEDNEEEVEEEFGVIFAVFNDAAALPIHGDVALIISALSGTDDFSFSHIHQWHCCRPDTFIVTDDTPEVLGPFDHITFK